MTYSYSFTGVTSQPSITATVQKIELTTTNVQLTIHSQDAVSAYNDASYLGFNDWELDVTKDISSFYNGNVRKEFVYIENNVLTLTTSVPNSSDYPDSFDSALNFTKQSDTPVDPDPITITLTDAMFTGKTYTYGESPNLITVDYLADYTYSGTGDGGTNGTWTITDNKLVMTDAIGTTTITFLSDSIAHAIAQDNGQEPNDMGEGPYTVADTATS